MYDSQTALIANYINPIIGDMEVQDITTRVVDKYSSNTSKDAFCFYGRNRKLRTELSRTQRLRKSSNFYGVLLSKLFVGN